MHRSNYRIHGSKPHRWIGSLFNGEHHPAIAVNFFTTSLDPSIGLIIMDIGHKPEGLFLIKSPN